jgi:hypothetical protein
LIKSKGYETILGKYTLGKFENGAEVYQIIPAGGLEEWFMEITKTN